MGYLVNDIQHLHTELEKIVDDYAERYRDVILKEEGSEIHMHAERTSILKTFTSSLVEKVVETLLCKG